jgi:predicted transcriptional regulator
MKQRALTELEFLSASPNRQRILDALSEREKTPDVLGDTLELPRSTLQRNLSALEEHGYVTHHPTANTYEMTTAGRLARSALADALSTISTATTLAPFLEQFPVDLPVDTETLADCEVILATADDPYQPVSAVKTAVAAAEHVRGFMPTVNPLYIESVRKYDVGDISLDAIAPPDAYEALAERYEGILQRMTQSPTISLYESTAVPDFVVLFAGETLLLGAVDEHRRTHSILRAPSASPVFDWAEQRYEDTKDEAVPLE